MSEILFVNACVRENSRTLDLAKHVLSQLDGSVDEVKLYEKEISPISAEDLKSRDNAFLAKDFSDSRYQHLACLRRTCAGFIK
jgi:FMN-dependent NADH-azoreductase